MVKRYQSRGYKSEYIPEKEIEKPIEVDKGRSELVVSLNDVNVSDDFHEYVKTPEEILLEQEAEEQSQSEGGADLKRIEAAFVGKTPVERKSMAEQIVSYMESMSFHGVREDRLVGIAQVLETNIREAFPNKESAHLKKTEAFSATCELDLTDVNVFIEKMRKVQPLDNEDLRHIAKIVFGNRIALDGIHGIVNDFLTDQIEQLKKVRTSVSTSYYKHILFLTNLFSNLASEISSIINTVSTNRQHHNTDLFKAFILENKDFFLSRLGEREDRGEFASFLYDEEQRKGEERRSKLTIMAQGFFEKSISLIDEILETLFVLTRSIDRLSRELEQFISGGDISKFFEYQQELSLAAESVRNQCTNTISHLEDFLKETFWLGKIFPPGVSGFGSGSISQGGLLVGVLAMLRSVHGQMRGVMDFRAYNIVGESDWETLKKELDRKSKKLSSIEMIGYKYSKEGSDSASYMFYLTNEFTQGLLDYGFSSEQINGIRGVVSNEFFDRAGIDSEITNTVADMIREHLQS